MISCRPTRCLFAAVQKPCQTLNQSLQCRIAQGFLVHFSRPFAVMIRLELHPRLQDEQRGSNQHDCRWLQVLLGRAWLVTENFYRLAITRILSEYIESRSCQV